MLDEFGLALSQGNWEKALALLPAYLEYLMSCQDEQPHLIEEKKSLWKRHLMMVLAEREATLNELQQVQRSRRQNLKLDLYQGI